MYVSDKQKCFWNYRVQSLTLPHSSDLHYWLQVCMMIFSIIVLYKVLTELWGLCSWNTPPPPPVCMVDLWLSKYWKWECSSLVYTWIWSTHYLAATHMTTFLRWWQTLSSMVHHVFFYGQAIRVEKQQWRYFPVQQAQSNFNAEGGGITKFGGMVHSVEGRGLTPCWAVCISSEWWIETVWRL